MSETRRILDLLADLRAAIGKIRRRSEASFAALADAVREDVHALAEAVRRPGKEE